ncbi:MAG TPA: HAMP domain-containing sensor histidine kinase, partial [Clostridiales bacterium]|nr:HAMP domain-containing sensor histidine kinase [Clostridiales bacterium]
IAPELLGKVKEKFFKADNAERGAGIGLAIADEIVKLHGGTLNIDSILGEGTTVTIELPVEEYIEESQV